MNKNLFDNIEKEVKEIQRLSTKKFKAWNRKTNKIETELEIRMDNLNSLNDISNKIYLEYIWIKDKDNQEIYELDIVYCHHIKLFGIVQKNWFWSWVIYFKQTQDHFRFNPINWTSLQNWIEDKYNSLENMWSIFENKELYLEITEKDNIEDFKEAEVLFNKNK